LIFNTFAYYLLFLIPASILFRLVAPRVRPWILTAFGVGFFIYFSFVALVGAWAALCILLFVWEALLSRRYAPGARICLLGVAVSVGILAFFKYWNFVTGLVTTPLGSNAFEWRGAFLPLGVSFFTFEFIHYAVDRYKGRTEKGSLGEYLAFIFFFPTMVAGPIKRYQDFLPCLREPSRDWSTDYNRGLTRILVGLVKKFAFADFLTSLTDHLNVQDISLASRPLLLLWLLAYGFKIYFDFSAYSDIAIGSGRLFGIKIPENFSWPYWRTNIADFWRSWHISLYKWLVEYVFIPIGGSRGTLLFVCRNTLIVMMVSGIWHGAGLNFVVWGLWHGALLVGHRLWTVWREKRAHAAFSESVLSRDNPMGAVPTITAKGVTSSTSLPLRIAGWALTFTLVNLGWAFFAMDLPTATFYFQRLLGG